MAKVRLYVKEKTAGDRAVAREAVAKWGRSQFRVGQWVVVLRTGVEAKIIGYAVRLGLGWEYRLRARGSKRTFYRRQYELAPLNRPRLRRSFRTVPRRRKKVGLLGMY